MCDASASRVGGARFWARPQHREQTHLGRASATLLLCQLESGHSACCGRQTSVLEEIGHDLAKMERVGGEDAESEDNDQLGGA